MEELYILGNGFDLYLGLKTRYSDYFKNRKISEEFFEKIKSIFKNSIGSYNYDARTKVYTVFDYDETLLNMQIVQLYKDIEKNLTIYPMDDKADQDVWDKEAATIKADRENGTGSTNQRRPPNTSNEACGNKKK
mgnify:CR=1 FL=1